MTGPIKFEKWEGLGNDFVLVEDEPSLDDVRRLCDRRLGVGADGVLWVQRAPAPRMVVFNADGSRPEMCGNGLRCVAAYLASEVGRHELVVQTDAGPRACRVDRGAPGAVATVRVDMGSARFGAEARLHDEERDLRFASVDMGNPHAVTFEPCDEAAYRRVGSALERQTPGGVNVEFVRSQPGRLQVVVWERGVGFTQACGTGACAVAAAACRAGLAAFGRPITVGLPGGDLEIEVAQGDDGSSGAIQMSGPARAVFQGIFTG